MLQRCITSTPPAAAPAPHAMPSGPGRAGARPRCNDRDRHNGRRLSGRVVVPVAVAMGQLEPPRAAAAVTAPAVRVENAAPQPAVLGCRVVRAPATRLGRARHSANVAGRPPPATMAIHAAVRDDIVVGLLDQNLDDHLCGPRRRNPHAVAMHSSHQYLPRRCFRNSVTCSALVFMLHPRASGYPYLPGRPLRPQGAKPDGDHRSLQRVDTAPHGRLLEPGSVSGRVPDHRGMTDRGSKHDVGRRP